MDAKNLFVVATIENLYIKNIMARKNWRINHWPDKRPPKTLEKPISLDDFGILPGGFDQKQLLKKMILKNPCGKHNVYYLKMYRAI